MHHIMYIYTVVEVEFQQSEYSPEEGDGSVTVCAEMSGRTDREVSVLFSTIPSQEGALGKNIAFPSKTVG